MSGKRIVEETPCQSGCGQTDFPSSIETCPGGSRRTLTEGQYVLIEKVDGEWPKWAWQAVQGTTLRHYESEGKSRLDALSDHTEGTP